MKCPHCNKEIKDNAMFCGFCGKQIPQIQLEEASLSHPPNEAKSKVTNQTTNIPAEDVVETQKKKTKDKPKKKHTTFKVLLIFVLISFISGSVLGFLTARGVISFKSLIPNNNFRWTNFSEGQIESIENNDTSEDKENEKEANSKY